MNDEFLADELAAGVMASPSAGGYVQLPEGSPTSSRVFQSTSSKPRRGQQRIPTTNENSCSIPYSFTSTSNLSAGRPVSAAAAACTA
jgi:hypothetical protein